MHPRLGVPRIAWRTTDSKGSNQSFTTDLLFLHLSCPNTVMLRKQDEATMWLKSRERDGCGQRRIGMFE